MLGNKRYSNLKVDTLFHVVYAWCVDIYKPRMATRQTDSATSAAGCSLEVIAQALMLVHREISTSSS